VVQRVRRVMARDVKMRLALHDACPVVAWCFRLPA